MYLSGENDFIQYTTNLFNQGSNLFSQDTSVSQGSNLFTQGTNLLYFATSSLLESMLGNLFYFCIF